MPLEEWIGGAMLIALILYALSGGADFGGGVWDLLASGPRAKAQRELISQAIAPIWEANHVWLILVIVLLFVAFPPAFAAVMTALHIPLTLMLVGIVLRGSAFVFRSYGIQSQEAANRWGLTFAAASAFTPIMLGISLGAVASGSITADPQSGIPQVDFFSSWLAPFPVVVGLFILALFAYLAAIYLTLEAKDIALQEDFRRRALITAVLVGVLAWGAFLSARNGAPGLYDGLIGQWWSLPFQLATGAAAAATLVALWRRHYLAARVTAVIQTVLIIAGWGASQYPHILPPDLTFTNTAAPDSVLRPLLIALILGGLFLFPTFIYLYRIFKRNNRDYL